MKEEERGQNTGQRSPESLPLERLWGLWRVTMLVGFCPYRGVHKPWEILASFPKGYEVIMEFLLQKLTPHQKSKSQEPSHRREISPLIVWRGPLKGLGAGAGVGGPSWCPIPGCPEFLGPLPLTYPRLVEYSNAESWGGRREGFLVVLPCRETEELVSHSPWVSLGEFR